MEQSKEVALVESQEVEIIPHNYESVFTEAKFAHAKEVAKYLATSGLAPKGFAQNLGSCLIAYEMSLQLRVSPFMVMQNMYPDVVGVPTLKSPFVIALLRTRSDFHLIEWVFEEQIDQIKSCTLFATHKKTSKIYQEKLTWVEVEGHGWLSKQGSFWKKMPRQMFKYRTAAFFLRTHQPELLFGLALEDEVKDYPEQESKAAKIREVFDIQDTNKKQDLSLFGVSNENL